MKTPARITSEDLRAKRCEVHSLYVRFGIGHEFYETSFDELHDLNLLFMAQEYRKTNGLLPFAKTPYCED